jgi:hypothetical protein
MAALYVDVTSGGNWNRPMTGISQEQARDFLQDAANDYRLQYWRYSELKILEAEDPELFQGLTQWVDRPQLPHPE